MFIQAAGDHTGSPHTGFVFRYNIVRHGTLGTGPAATVPNCGALAARFTSPTVAGNLLIGGPVVSCLTGNGRVSAEDDVGFVDWQIGDLRLAATSSFHGGAADGHDVGYDRVAFQSLGTTFTDATFTPGVDSVRAIHVTELRRLIDDLRASVTIRRDTTPPTFTATRLSSVPASGWTNQNVEVEFEASDALSGIGGNPKGTAVLTAEGANLTASWVFYDRAGNAVTATLGGINIDKTRPVIGFRFAHLNENATPAEIAAETLKWHNHIVTLIVDAQDPLSGVASVDPAQFVFTAEGINLKGSATVVDRAGNSATDLTAAIKIDRTPPTISLLNRLPVANQNGWNNGDITVKWTCADALSGVVSPVVSQTLSMEGANRSLTGTCVDLADNTKSDTRGGLNLDKTPPVVQCAANPAVLFGPNKKMLPVKVALTFTDALAGPWSYAMTQLASSEAGGADDIAGFAIGSTLLGGSLRAERDRPGFSRIYTLGYEGRDRAGNTAACSTTVTVPRDPT